MKIYHNTRDLNYRNPFGAVTIGTTVHLSLDIEDTSIKLCELRVWIDGEGETIYPMHRYQTESAKRSELTTNNFDVEDDQKDASIFKSHIRYTIDITPTEPCILWYSFIIHFEDDSILRYGAKQGRTGGEGMIYDYEPPSFQITVSKLRQVPSWYKQGIVYQIFPDRFNRDSNYQERCNSFLELHKHGITRSIQAEWNTIPRYIKDEKGNVVEWSFYAGSLQGIADKLDYIKDLGATIIYLNPIYESASNHRYDTADYKTIDPLLGTNEDFKQLCNKADQLGISIILDGVFNHTGCDSIYFNKYLNYPEPGAYQGISSKYYNWYQFDDSPCGYQSWWGVCDLPAVNKNSSEYQKFIYGSKDSVVRSWLRLGAKGWRLDVADELSDEFIVGIKQAIIDELGDNALLLGEVWEDASNKISYGKLRKYLLGEELDSTMNYPFRASLLSFLTEKCSAETLFDQLLSLYENYPKEAFYSSLNLIGSHDRARILTLLGISREESSFTEDVCYSYRLSYEEKQLAKKRFWLMTFVQMTMPGVPSIYYGDEAGMEGFADPYNRGAFPWGLEDKDTMTMYRNAISLRKLFPHFIHGEFEPFYYGEDVFGYCRSYQNEELIVLIHRNQWKSEDITIPVKHHELCELVTGQQLQIHQNSTTITLAPLSTALIYCYDHKPLVKELKKGCGILCHITSLPSKYTYGTIGEPAYKFIDYLSSTHQNYWQILPLSPTDEYNSPYAGSSAFAGNIKLLGLTEKELRASYQRFEITDDYEVFCSDNAEWLMPYSIFCALETKFHSNCWQQWPEPYNTYSDNLCEEKEIRDQAAYYRYTQYLFHKNWNQVREYASKSNIEIIGDLPMYVASTSVDVWANPELFKVDSKGYPTLVAGVPPDYFSEEGQLWNNPIYDWEQLKTTNYDWWIRRLKRALELYDYVRLDHFRGFESYWAIPSGEPAIHGFWKYGPGYELFEKAYEKLGPLPVVAEDLGVITPAVRGLVSRCGFPGIDVCQFVEQDPYESYLPPKSKIAYSGTHDNETLLDWCKSRYPDRDPLLTSDHILHKLYESNCPCIMIPLQDILHLDNSSRMNTPGTVNNNWSWQAKEEDIISSKEYLASLTSLRTKN